MTESELSSIAAPSGKLMPEDIDRYLTARAKNGSAQGGFQEQPLSPHQRILASRLVRSASHVVPGTIMCPVCWDAIERERVRVKASGDSFQPSAFTMFAFAVASSLPEFPLFRSSLVGEDRVRTYEHVSLGIAVGLPTGDLVVAAVENADALPWREFADRTRERIELARSGKDQATDLVTISLTNMQGLGVREAIPVVVAPSVATLFLGEVYTGIDPDEDTPKFQLLANLSLTFDHRLINGVAAAKFLAAIKSRVETISAHLI